jgi:hypothetical protein
MKLLRKMLRITRLSHYLDKYFAAKPFVSIMHPDIRAKEAANNNKTRGIYE